MSLYFMLLQVQQQNRKKRFGCSARKKQGIYVITHFPQKRGSYTLTVQKTVLKKLELCIKRIKMFGIVTRSDVGRRSTNSEERFGNELSQSEIAELQRFQSLTNVFAVVLVCAQVDNLKF